MASVKLSLKWFKFSGRVVRNSDPNPEIVVEAPPLV
jgi:hypothetical protein